MPSWGPCRPSCWPSWSSTPAGSGGPPSGCACRWGSWWAWWWSARLSGVSTARVSAITWAIAGGLSAVAAILQMPSFGANGAASAATLGPLLLLLALGAAAVGAFTSLPAALGGGLLIGLAYQIAL